MRLMRGDSGLRGVLQHSKPLARAPLPAPIVPIGSLASPEIRRISGPDFGLLDGVSGIGGILDRLVSVPRVVQAAQIHPFFRPDRSSLRPDLAIAGRLRAGPVKDGRLATAAAARSVLCAGHVQQPGGESPLCNLMEVKHERSARAEPRGWRGQVARMSHDRTATAIPT